MLSKHSRRLSLSFIFVMNIHTHLFQASKKQKINQRAHRDAAAIGAVATTSTAAPTTNGAATGNSTGLKKTVF